MLGIASLIADILVFFSSWSMAQFDLCLAFYARQHICCSAYMLSLIRLSVRLSVRQTGVSYKNG